MFIKRFIRFINEELIWGLDKLETGKQNYVLQLFSNDKSKIREFLQSCLRSRKSPNIEHTKLKYLGGGGMGLTFEWIEPSKLEDDFENQNFFGTQEYQATDKNLIIKITANSGEADKIIEVIKEGGKKPGLARYFWIKKVDLPDPSMQYSKLLGPPTYYFDDRGVKKKRIEEWINLRTQGEKSKASNRGKKISDERAKDKARQRFEEDIEKLKEKKTKNIWIICIEQLQIPNERQKNILNLAISYFWCAANINKLPAVIITRHWLNDKIISQFYDYLQNEEPTWHGFELSADDKKMYRDLNLSKEELKDNIIQIYNLYIKLSNLSAISNKKLLHKLGLDFHPGNLGYDEYGNLTAFDMWV